MPPSVVTADDPVQAYSPTLFLLLAGTPRVSEAKAQQQPPA